MLKQTPGELSDRLGRARLLGAVDDDDDVEGLVVFASSRT